MPADPKVFKAHLIKYRDPESDDFVWFWINSSTGKKISGDFFNQDEAEIWFRDIMKIHNETNQLIARAQYGKFFKIRALLEEPYIIKSDCPFHFQITEDNTLSITTLALDMKDAQKRVREYFEIKEWIKGGNYASRAKGKKPENE